MKQDSLQTKIIYIYSHFVQGGEILRLWTMHLNDVFVLKNKIVIKIG